ncbi:MAG: nitroreductase family protein [Nitrososphaerales archaeon]
MDVFEAIDTLISIRRIKDTPVEEWKIERILSAAVKAPSGANTQPWEFIVVKDPEVKKRIAEINRRGASIYLEARIVKLEPKRRQYLEDCLQRMHNIPVMIILCLNREKKLVSRPKGFEEASRKMEEIVAYASVFPAMQNMLLAARALELGCWITMYHLYFEDEFRHLLNIPNYIEPLAIINIGYPKGRFKPAQRRPYTEVTHRERWEKNCEEE